MLTLQTRRAPPGIPVEKRQLATGSLQIGRGSGCDWTLPDPDRVLSKCHCQVIADRGGWQVIDLSRNGTFLNGRVLEAGVPYPVRHGDRLTLGSYDIELGITDQEPYGPGRPGMDHHQTGNATHPAVEDLAIANGLGSHDLPISGSPDARALFESVALESLFSPRSELAADRASDLRVSYRPPRPSSELLPEDWNEPTGRSAIPDRADTGSQPPSPAPLAMALPATSAVREAPGPSTDAASAFATLAAGAGLPGAVVADPAAALRGIGAAFRAMVRELRRSMMVRAAIKNEFRIEQTMIRVSGNNPLKFAADEDDALAALLGDGRGGGMSPERAVLDALGDMRLHEFAVTAAMRQGVSELLDQLAPARLDAGVGGGVADMLGRRQARLWRRFVERHEALTSALAEDFDSAFAKAFARAYQAALDEARAADARPRAADAQEGEDAA